MWVFYSFIFLLFAGVLLGSVLRLARHSSDAALSGLSSFLPPLTLFCCLIILIFAPFSTPPPSVVTRSIHYAGIMLLLVFLLFGALCQILVWTKIHRNESLASVAKTYEFWWIATKVAPAPAALCILTSGVRLVYESPANGFLQLPWLFWLIVSFSFFFFDGLLFYLPEQCRIHDYMKKAVEDKKTLADFLQNARSRKNEWLLMLHSISFPFVYGLGCAKPINIPVPNGLIVKLQTAFPNWSPDMARAGHAVLLILFVGGAIALLRVPGLILWLRSRPKIK